MSGRKNPPSVSRTDGKILWQKDLDSYLPEDPFSGMGVPEHGYASSTPVSDGQNVYVFFGKTGVVALDLDGKELWKTSVGTASGQMRWGSGASPIEFGDVLANQDFFKPPLLPSKQGRPFAVAASHATHTRLTH